MREYLVQMAVIVTGQYIEAPSSSEAKAIVRRAIYESFERSKDILAEIKVESAAELVPRESPLSSPRFVP